jgi:hypothetical protein
LLTEFIGNTTRIGRQIGLLRTARVTGMDTQVGGQTGLLRTVEVTQDSWGNWDGGSG